MSIMPGIYPQVGASNWLFEHVSSLTIFCDLFQNNVALGQGTVNADLTICDFSGYIGGVVTSGWAVPIITGGHSKTAANLLSFIHDGGPVSNNVFSYRYTDASGNLLFVEKFAAPILMQAGSPPLQFFPVLTFISEFLTG